ncbi:conserved exported hypothetical protein [Verrucomicrobia bacterium]|nr:conserved exported hypothetical protein [Verrucomicrobiota bacterium]
MKTHCLSCRRRAWPGANFLLLVLLLAHPIPARAQAWLDSVSDSLFLQSRGGTYRVNFSGLFDLEGYYIDQRPPGLIFGGGDSFVTPRLSLFVDAQAGKHLYAYVQTRFDDGFHPRAPESHERVDEYLFRYTPLDGPQVNLQVGKFATVVGNWVARHLSWDNPFINEPLPYDNILTVSDVSVPASPADFLARRGQPDQKDKWLTVVWGPDYTSGASVFGSVTKWDYAVEVKNASLSSRSTAWDATDVGWDNPTVSGRFGFRPNVAWNLGLSGSYGTYLQKAAEQSPAFPVGKGLSDFNQITVAEDASYQWHQWRLWAELFLSRFQVPNVGNADTLVYYLEAKYQITPQLFGALRWNQELYGDINSGTGGQTPWDNNVWRIDLALGYRFTRHFQSKLQYSFTHQAGQLQQGEQLVAAQATLKF